MWISYTRYQYFCTLLVLKHIYTYIIYSLTHLHKHTHTQTHTHAHTHTHTHTHTFHILLFIYSHLIISIPTSTSTCTYPTSPCTQIRPSNAASAFSASMNTGKYEALSTVYVHAYTGMHDHHRTYSLTFFCFLFFSQSFSSLFPFNSIYTLLSQ